MIVVPMLTVCQQTYLRDEVSFGNHCAVATYIFLVINAKESRDREVHSVVQGHSGITLIYAAVGARSANSGCLISFKVESVLRY